MALKDNVHVSAQLNRRRMTINVLPEEALLEIFDIYVDPTRKYNGIEAWCTLVHVCQKWRNIVLESPHRLNLRIRYYPTTPEAREKLDIWPDLPIVLMLDSDDWEQIGAVVNVAMAFEQNNRICQISLGCISTQIEEILAAMHKPFPVLTHLDLDLENETLETLIDPDLFLGGSAPCLRSLRLSFVLFPGLPKLLLSVTHLTDLFLFPSGYISPEAMVSFLSTLTRLETLILRFESPELEHRHSLLPSRTLLPALTLLRFYGSSKYLENLLTWIDTPLLVNLKICLLPRSISDIPQLVQFINRTPRLKSCNEAQVVFYNPSVRFILRRVFEGLGISHEVVDLQFSISSMARVYTSSLSWAFSATVERLYIYDNDEYRLRRGDVHVGNDHWLEIISPFTSVKSLYLSRENVRRIAPALRKLVGEKVTEVLPALQTLFLENIYLFGPVKKAIGLFVSRRRLSGHPVAISQWKK